MKAVRSTALLGLLVAFIFLSLTRSKPTQPKTTMSDTQPKSIVSLIGAVLAAAVSAINTSRVSAEEVQKIKSDYEGRIKELEDKLREEENEDAEIEALRPQLEDLLKQAVAAKPPTGDNIASAEESLNSGQLQDGPGEGDSADNQEAQGEQG